MMRENKKYWKALLSIELIFVAIMMSVCGLIYKLYWDKVYSDSTSYMYDIFCEVRENLYADKDIDTVLFEMCQEIPGAGFDGEYTDNFAMELSLYDENLNLQEEIAGKLAAIAFEIYDEKTDASHYEWFDLTDYFGEEQIAEFRDFYFTTIQKHDSATIDIRYMKGFYDANGEFIPTEISFYDLNSEATIVLESTQKYDQPNQKIMIKRSEDDCTNSRMWVYDTREKCVEKLQLAKEGELVDTRTYRDYSFMHDLEDEVPSFDLKMYADVPAIIIESDGFFAYIIISVILLQLCGAFIMWGYVYFQKKQRELSDSRDLFINAMAHELKTPVAVVQNTVEYLQTGNRPEKQAHYLDLLQKETVHMNQLLSDMLTYTRVSQATHHLKLEKTNLKELVLEVMESYQELLQNKHISVEWNEEAEGVIRCDRSLMRMVVDNLLSNAIKYGDEEGKIRITIRKKELAIFNNGPHLSEEDLTQVWNPMYRVDKARTADGSSGMGLAISAGIMKLHGATFGADNLEQGVEFHFSFEKVVLDNKKYSKKKLILLAIIYYICAILAVGTMVMYATHIASPIPAIMELFLVLWCFGLGTFYLIQSRNRK